MLSHLLDTSVYSQRLKPRPAKTVIDNWTRLGDSALALSACCEAELLFGLRKKRSQRLWTEYEEFLRDRLVLVPFGYREAADYANIRESLVRAGEPVADMDLMIAATARANNLTLATLNPRHFEKIPGLRMEDWSGPLPA